MDRRSLLAGLGLALAAGPALAGPQPWTSLRGATPLPPARESGHIRNGDVELYYAVYGRGHPVLFLHPGLGHADYWANQIGPFSQTHQVVVMDLRGHGRSTRSDTPLSYGLLVGDVLKVIQKLNLGKPTIVGWGDGATTGLEFAIRHPGRLRKLVGFGMLYDTAGQQPDVDKTPTFIEYVRKTAEDYQRLSPNPAGFEPLFRQLEAMWKDQPHYSAEQLGAIEIPVGVLAAEYDEWVQMNHMVRASELIPSAQFALLQDVSHFAPWQAPKTFNDVLGLSVL